MKKRISIILAFVFVLAAITQVAASATESDLTNIALGCTYTYTEPYKLRTYPNDYQLVDDKELTDGVKSGTTFGTVWIGWYNAATFNAVIDLGTVKVGIVKLSMCFEQDTSSSVFYPKYVKYSVSEDNEKFTEIGTYSTESGAMTTDIAALIPDGVSARYVKAEVARGTGMFVFCSEFEVFTGTLGDEESTGSEYDEDDEIGLSDSDFNNPDDPAAMKEGTKPDYNSVRVLYNSGEFIQSDYKGFGLEGAKLIRGVRQLTSDDDFVSTLGTVSSTVSGAVSGIVGTGAVAHCGSDTAAVIVDGDANGDGKVSALDYLIAKRIIIGIAPSVSAYGKCAVDIDGDCSIGAVDYLAIKRSIIGSFELYSKYDDPDRAETHDMVFRQDSATVFSATCDSDIGKVKITFDKKDWGTWNIGTWSVDGTRVCGGGTDWEYVYRAGASTSTQFAGGNHGSEDLLSIEFFDSSTGKKLNPAVGTSQDIKGLKIVEKTRIKYTGSTTAFMNVTRTYYVIGTRITLETEYELVKDTYFNVSYTCMFPVPKTQGRFITMHKSNGDVSYTSLKIGYPGYAAHYYGKTNASSATITGYKGKDVQFDVSVYGEDATQSFDSELKTFYWDMNENENKLYFSVFGNTASKVPAGVKWSIKASWVMSGKDA